MLSGPTKGPDVPTITHGVNRPDGRHFGVQGSADHRSRLHRDQALVDNPSGAKDLRRGRAPAQNFVPSSTGAASAAAKALPAMEGRFDGVAVRGPVVVGGNLVKVISWYNNEWGFTSQMVQVALQQLGLDTHASV